MLFATLLTRAISEWQQSIHITQEINLWRWPMAQTSNSPEPIQFKPKGVWKVWQDFIDWKDGKFNQLKLWLAAVTVNSFNDEEMKRLAATFSDDLVHADDHLALENLVAGLKVKEERLKKKDKVVRKRNLQIKGLKADIEGLQADVADRDLLIKLLLDEAGITIEEFIQHVADAQNELEETSTQIDLALKENADKRAAIQSLKAAKK